MTETTAVAPPTVLYAGTPDTVLAAAVQAARAAALEVGAEAVGEHLGVIAEGELLVTHRFESRLPGYVGWYWAVSLVRAPEQDFATVADVVLLPGEGALRAPAWVPWSERLRPGDLGPGDLLPSDPSDVRLVPAYVTDEDEQLRQVAFELGLGRERVMSRDGRIDIAERWYDGEYGPDSAMARQAPGHCGTCGFLLPMAGSLRGGFGVCGNEISSADGRAVSVEYGCGAHSQVKVKVAPLSERVGEVYDDRDVLAVIALREPGESADATLAPVLGQQDTPEQAQDESVETDPEPAAVAVVIEPAEEDQAEHEGDQPEGDAG